MADQTTSFYFDSKVFVKELSSELTEAISKEYSGIEDSADNLSTLVPTGQASVIRNNPYTGRHRQIVSIRVSMAGQDRADRSELRSISHYSIPRAIVKTVAGELRQ